MAKIIVEFPPSIRLLLGGEKATSVNATTALEALDKLSQCDEGLRDRLFDADGHLKRFIQVCVNGNQIDLQDSQPLSDGDLVFILIALAGG